MPNTTITIITVSTSWNYLTTRQRFAKMYDFMSDFPQVVETF